MVQLNTMIGKKTKFCFYSSLFILIEINDLAQHINSLGIFMCTQYPNQMYVTRPLSLVKYIYIYKRTNTFHKRAFKIKAGALPSANFLIVAFIVARFVICQRHFFLKIKFGLSIESIPIPIISLTIAKISQTKLNMRKKQKFSLEGGTKCISSLFRSYRFYFANNIFVSFILLLSEKINQL